MKRLPWPARTAILARRPNSPACGRDLLSQAGGRGSEVSVSPTRLDPCLRVGLTLELTLGVGQYDPRVASLSQLTAYARPRRSRRRSAAGGLRLLTLSSTANPSPRRNWTSP